jgi:hypothetical protein
LQDLERLFRHLVQVLMASDPSRLQQPVSVGDLTSRLVPYRTSRRSLGVESSEDYELLLLRFAAGEGGFAMTEPGPVRVRFATEAGSPNPDLSVLREFRDAAFVLQPVPLARVLSGASENEAYAPPPPPDPAPLPAMNPVEHAPEPEPVTDAVEALPFDAVRTAPAEAAGFEPELDPVAPEPLAPVAAARCSYCGGALPAGRTVHFCPHCGQSQTTGQCPRCRAEVEYGWRHCVSCGTALTFDG